MASLNKVFLIGNLTKDPQLRYTANGTAVADLRLAVNRKYKTQAGEVKEEVCYLNVVVWGKIAVACQEYVFKGSPVLVEGRLQSRSWEDKESGQKRSTLEVVADSVQFLGKKKEGEIQEEIVTSDAEASQVDESQ